jgi:hypothetical protein
VDIPPPPPPPSPDGTPQPGAQPAGPPPPPPPPASYGTPPQYRAPSPYGPPSPNEPGSPHDNPPPYQGGSPYDSGPPHAAPPPYPEGPYGGPSPYGAPGAGTPPPYSGAPYGAPGPYGYPMPPQGWYVERPTNGLAIASLATSLTCVPVLPVVFGIISLRQVRRRGDRGKGLAIAGICVSVVLSLLTALLVTLAAVGGLDEGNTRVADLVAGDCFNPVHGSLPAHGVAGFRATTVDVVACQGAHVAETFEVFPLDAGPDGGYPGAGQTAQIAGSRCADYAGDYLGQTTLPESMDIYSFTPPEQGWDSGDHDVACFFGSRSGKVTGSVTEAGGGSGFGV